MDYRNRYWDFLTIRNVKLLLHKIFDKPIDLSDGDDALHNNNAFLILKIREWLTMHADGQQHYFYDHVRRYLNFLPSYAQIRQIIHYHPHFIQYTNRVEGKHVNYHRRRRTLPEYATRCKNSKRECKKGKPKYNPHTLQMFLTLENVRDFYNYMLERDMGYFPKCGNLLRKFTLSLSGRLFSSFMQYSLYELLHMFLLEQLEKDCDYLHLTLCEYIGYQQFIRNFPPTIFRLVAMMEQIQKQMCMTRDPIVILFADEYVMEHIVTKI